MGVSELMLLDVPTTLMGTLTMEPGVVFLLWDCLPSRTFGLLFPPIGGMFEREIELNDVSHDQESDWHMERDLIALKGEFMDATKSGLAHCNSAIIRVNACSRFLVDGDGDGDGDGDEDEAANVWYCAMRISQPCSLAMNSHACVKCQY